MSGKFERSRFNYSFYGQNFTLYIETDNDYPRTKYNFVLHLLRFPSQHPEFHKIGYDDDEEDNSGEEEFGINLRGSLHGCIINTKKAKNIMYEVCDADSEDLMEAGTTLFENNGRLKWAILSKVVDRVRVESGNFMYLKYFDIYDPLSRHQGLSFTMLKALFSRLDDYNCSLCAFLCVPFKFNDQYYGENDGEYVTPPIDNVARISEKIARHFARIGFCQAGTSKYMFLEISQLPVIPHTIAPETTVFTQRVDIAAVENPPLNEHDKKVLPYIEKEIPFDEAVIRHLVAAGATVNESCLLQSCAANGNLPVMRLLLSLRAYVNKGDSRGYTALMLACSAGAWDCVTHLLQVGADTDIRDSEGNSALSHLRMHRTSLRNMSLMLNIPSLASSLPIVDEFMQVLRARMTPGTYTDSEDEGDEEMDDDEEDEDDLDLEDVEDEEDGEEDEEDGEEDDDDTMA